MPNCIEITVFTDPMCPWSYASEPILRKAKSHYGERLHFRFVMSKSFLFSADDTMERRNHRSSESWHEVAERYEMPVRLRRIALFDDKHPDSSLAAIAYKAAQFQDERLARDYLRRIREATAAENALTTHGDILTELAGECGLNIVSFFHNLESGRAEKAYYGDIAVSRSSGITALPSYLLKYQSQSIVLSGFQTYEGLESAIDNISKGRLKSRIIPKDEKQVLEFIKRRTWNAPVEIKLAFDLSESEYAAIIRHLKDDGLIEEAEMGSHTVIRYLDGDACLCQKGVCYL